MKTNFVFIGFTIVLLALLVPFLAKAFYDIDINYLLVEYVAVVLILLLIVIIVLRAIKMEKRRKQKIKDLEDL